MIVTCVNEDCENHGLDITVQPPVDEETGEVPYTWVGVECGVCGWSMYDNPSYSEPHRDVQPPVGVYTYHGEPAEEPVGSSPGDLILDLDSRDIYEVTPESAGT